MSEKFNELTSGGMRGLVTLAGQFAILWPVLDGLDIHWTHILAVAAVTVVSLLGFNYEVFQRTLRDAGRLLIDVADEMERMSDDVVSAGTGFGGGVAAKGGRSALGTYPRSTRFSGAQSGKRDAAPEGNRDSGAADAFKTDPRDVIGRSQSGSSDLPRDFKG